MRAAYGQISATLVSLLVDLKAQIAERKEMEANVDENGWPRGWGDDDDDFDEELGEDDDEGDDAPLDDETLAKLASQAKRVNPFGGRGFGDDDDDDSDDDGMLTDDENVTPPIDKVDPFISFAEMMTATSAADPAKFAALNGGLTAEQQGAAQDLMRHADVRREEMAKEEAEEERKKTERAASSAPGLCDFERSSRDVFTLCSLGLDPRNHLSRVGHEDEVAIEVQLVAQPDEIFERHLGAAAHCSPNTAWG